MRLLPVPKRRRHGSSKEHYRRRSGLLTQLQLEALERRLLLDGNSLFGSREVVFENLADGIQEIAVADLDNDGDMDVVSASYYDHKIAWYENFDGSFDQAQHLITVVPDAGYATSIDVTDLDRDGDVDVLFNDRIGDRIFWSKSQGGSFDDARPLITTQARGIYSVASSDIDGDHHADIVATLITSSANREVVWFKNSGDETFGTKQLIGTYDGLQAVPSVTDLDGDGDVDVLIKADDRIAWHENREGSFDSAPHVITAFENRVGISDASLIRPADFNGDGEIDIFASWVSYPEHEKHLMTAWFENQGGGTAWHRHELSYFGSPFPRDVDGDGDIDVIGYGSAGISWLDNPGDGNFGPPTNIETVVTPYFYRMLVSDLDFDGDDDVLLSDWVGASWLEQLDGVKLSPPQTIIAGMRGLSDIAAGDLDGDGDNDVLAASPDDHNLSWYENRGGWFDGKQHVISSEFERASIIRCVDLDDDGDADVLGYSHVNDTLAWYQNVGGQIDDEPTFIDIDVGSGGVYPFRNLQTRDFDEDGDADLLIGLESGHGDAAVVLYKNLGGGVFETEPIVWNFPQGRLSVAPADVDGDGDIDIVVASEGDDAILWLKNAGGSFDGEKLVIAHDIVEGVLNLVIADLDGDGSSDVFLGGYDEQSWYRNLGEGAFDEQPTPVAVSGDLLDIVAGDLNEDGNIDLLTASWEEGIKIGWYENLGEGTFSSRHVIDDEAVGYMLRLTDLDRDGDADVLAANESDKITWYQNKSRSGTANITITSAEPIDAGTFQFTFEVTEGVDRFDVSLFRSADNQWDGSDVLIEEAVTISGFSTGESAASIGFRHNLGYDANSPYILVVADPANLIAETVENDNVALITYTPIAALNASLDSLGTAAELALYHDVSVYADTFADAVLALRDDWPELISEFMDQLGIVLDLFNCAGVVSDVTNITACAAVAEHALDAVLGVVLPHVERSNLRQWMYDHSEQLNEQDGWTRADIVLELTSALWSGIITLEDPTGAFVGLSEYVDDFIWDPIDAYRQEIGNSLPDDYPTGVVVRYLNNLSYDFFQTVAGSERLLRPINDQMYEFSERPLLGSINPWADGTQALVDELPGLLDEIVDVSLSAAGVSLAGVGVAKVLNVIGTGGTAAVIEAAVGLGVGILSDYHNYSQLRAKDVLLQSLDAGARVISSDARQLAFAIHTATNYLRAQQSDEEPWHAAIARPDTVEIVPDSFEIQDYGLLDGKIFGSTNGSIQFRNVGDDPVPVSANFRIWGANSGYPVTAKATPTMIVPAGGAPVAVDFELELPSTAFQSFVEYSADTLVWSGTALSGDYITDHVTDFSISPEIVVAHKVAKSTQTLRGYIEERKEIIYALGLANPLTASYTVVLILAGSDADLHIYDDLGNHIGLNYETGELENEIPGAQFFGGQDVYESIYVPTVEGRSYEAKVVGIETIGEEPYALLVSEDTNDAPLLAFSPPRVVRTVDVVQATSLEFTISALEIGKQADVIGLGLAATDLVLDGNRIPKENISIDIPSTTVPAGGMSEILISIDLPQELPSGRYLGTLEAVSGEITIPLEIDLENYPWCNPTNTKDVDSNGQIAPYDALLIINELNRNGIHTLSTDRTRPLQPPFYDVSRDGILAPYDALLVINYLNRYGITGAEGESSGDNLAPTLLLQADSSPARLKTDAVTEGDQSTEVSQPDANLPTSIPTGLPVEALRELRLWADEKTDWTDEDLEEMLAELAAGIAGSLDL
jgi:hypothetical protein